MVILSKYAAISCKYAAIPSKYAADIWKDRFRSFGIFLYLVALCSDSAPRALIHAPCAVILLRRIGDANHDGNDDSDHGDDDNDYNYDDDDDIIIRW